MKITYKNPTLSQHTPGPWREGYTDAFGKIQIGTLTEVVAEVYNTANANLVRAAPDLLKACIMARSCMRPNDNDATAQALDAAIAKATPEGSG